jgi:hypothetical protein
LKEIRNFFVSPVSNRYMNILSTNLIRFLATPVIAYFLIFSVCPAFEKIAKTDLSAIQILIAAVSVILMAWWGLKVELNSRRR